MNNLKKLLRIKGTIEERKYFYVEKLRGIWWRRYWGSDVDESVAIIFWKKN